MKRLLVRSFLGLFLALIIYVVCVILNSFFGFVPAKINFQDENGDAFVFEKHIGPRPKSYEGYWTVYEDDGIELYAFIKVRVTNNELGRLELSGTPVTSSVTYGEQKPFWWSPPRDLPVYSFGTTAHPCYYCYDPKTKWLFMDYDNR